MSTFQQMFDQLDQFYSSEVPPHEEELNFHLQQPFDQALSFFQPLQSRFSFLKPLFTSDDHRPLYFNVAGLFLLHQRFDLLNHFYPVQRRTTGSPNPHDIERLRAYYLDSRQGDPFHFQALFKEAFSVQDSEALSRFRAIGFHSHVLNTSWGGHFLFQELLDQCFDKVSLLLDDGCSSLIQRHKSCSFFIPTPPFLRASGSRLSFTLPVIDPLTVAILQKNFDLASRMLPDYRPSSSAPPLEASSLSPFLAWTLVNGPLSFFHALTYHLELSPIDLFLDSFQGMNAFSWAAYLSHLPVIQLLLDRDYPVDREISSQQPSALMLSIKNRDMVMLDYLLLHKAADAFKNSSLSITDLANAFVPLTGTRVCTKSLLNEVPDLLFILNRLSKESIDFNVPDASGTTLLMKLSLYPHCWPEVLPALISYGARTDLRNQQGNTFEDYMNYPHDNEWSDSELESMRNTCFSALRKLSPSLITKTRSFFSR